MVEYMRTVMNNDVRARTVKGFCQAYGVGPTKVYELLKRGELVAVKAGRRTLILEESAQRWFASLLPKSAPIREIPEYSTWRSMIQRCTNSKREEFKWYGGRGITVCERWQTFENFYADMGTRPPGHSIDRINNDGNYEPGNCRWAPPKEQAANRRKRTKLPRQPTPLSTRKDPVSGERPRTMAKG